VVWCLNVWICEEAMLYGDAFSSLVMPYYFLLPSNYIARAQFFDFH